VHEAVGRAGRVGYREAVGLLTELRVLSERCRREGEFEDFLAALRGTNRRKTAFLDELDRAGLR